MTRLLLLLTLLRVRAPGLGAWLRQTSTILGLATAAGIFAGLAGGTMGWDVALPGLAGAMVSILMPGHPEIVSPVQRAALDAVLLARQGPAKVGYDSLVNDAAAAINIVVNATPPPSAPPAAPA